MHLDWMQNLTPTLQSAVEAYSVAAAAEEEEEEEEMEEQAADLFVSVTMQATVGYAALDEIDSAVFDGAVALAKEIEEEL